MEDSKPMIRISIGTVIPLITIVSVVFGFGITYQKILSIDEKQKEMVETISYLNEKVDKLIMSKGLSSR